MYIKLINSAYLIMLMLVYAVSEEPSRELQNVLGQYSYGCLVRGYPQGPGEIGFYNSLDFLNKSERISAYVFLMFHCSYMRQPYLSESLLRVIHEKQDHNSLLWEFDKNNRESKFNKYPYVNFVPRYKEKYEKMFNDNKSNINK